MSNKKKFEDDFKMHMFSYKHPNHKRIIYKRFDEEKHAPSEVLEGGKLYQMYGSFGRVTDLQFYNFTK